MVVRTFFLPISIVALRLLLIKFLPEVNDANYERVGDSAIFYDFIVIGSGAAGAPVAARLSEAIASWQVLVLEAGDNPPPHSFIPAFQILLYDDDSNWRYETAPQKYSMFGYEGRSNLFPRGKTIGGSSTINYMMCIRGNKRDYDNWAALGNHGWDYDTVLHYFKKSEDYHGNTKMNNSQFHGYGGPMTVTSKPWGTPLQETFLQAGLELGFPTIDSNAGSQVGFSTPDMTIKNGIRVSVADAFLKPNRNRQNLHIFPNSHVTKILFDENKRAVGVLYVRNGKRQVALAKREVILSAGAVDSPKLLMLSGVGPKHHLKEHYISVVHDLPGVGQNLQDHPVVWGVPFTTTVGSSLSISLFLNPSTMFDYFKTRKGPLSTAFGVEGNSWVQLSGGDPDWPDAQFLLMAGTPGLDKGLMSQSIIGYEKQVTIKAKIVISIEDTTGVYSGVIKSNELNLFHKYFSSIFAQEGFCIGPTIVRPKSRGSITLKSSDPFEQAVIDPNFLSHPDDLNLMIKAIKFAISIGKTKAFKYNHGAKFHDMPLPGCDHLVVESDEYWGCYARFLTSSVYHPAGSCKMAPSYDPMGVVDNKLRVRGVKGLRVIDASIMPVIVNGNTHATSVMIGERGADLIIEDWIKSYKNYD